MGKHNCITVDTV